MIFLIHLLTHLGVPTGVAIVILIAVRKLVWGGAAKTVRAIRGRDQRSPRDR